MMAPALVPYIAAQGPCQGRAAGHRLPEGLPARFVCLSRSGRPRRPRSASRDTGADLARSGGGVRPVQPRGRPGKRDPGKASVEQPRWPARVRSGVKALDCVSLPLVQYGMIPRYVRFGVYRLAPAEPVGQGPCVRPAPPGSSRPARAGRPAGLVECQRGFGQRARQAWGDHVGANPIDRDKPGSKLHLVSDGGQPRLPTPSRDHTADRPAWGRVLDPAGTPPVAGRADAVVAVVLPASGGSLGSGLKAVVWVRAAGLCACLLQGSTANRTEMNA